MIKINMHSKRVIIGLLVLALASVFVYMQLAKNTGQNDQNPITGTSSNGLDLSPATEDEIKQAEETKKENDQKQESINNSEASPNKVTPQITLAGVNGSSVEVSGYISQLFENDGTCKVLFTKNETITREVKAVREGNSTYCPLVTVPVSEFKSKGIWNVELRYSSTFSSGASQKTQVEIN